MATAEEYLEIVGSGPEPFRTASEVAEVVGVSRQTAYRHLQRLYEQGRLNKKKIGSSAVIWWTSC